MKKSTNNAFNSFWSIALSNNHVLSKMISKEDEDALKYLKNIKSITTSDEKEVTKQVEFFYETNPYFNNTSLTKTFKFDKNDGGLISLKSSDIIWKENRNYTKIKETKVLINKSK